MFRRQSAIQIRSVDKAEPSNRTVEGLAQLLSNLRSTKYATRSDTIDMRLLDVRTREFRQFDTVIPPYAIASHRWSNGEVDFQHFESHRRDATAGYQKVKGFCAFVLRERPDINWLWIDNCCINRADFTELSEAINSMCNWYRRSEFCIAFLEDVEDKAQMAGSVWFERGWTLQELLAPKTVVLVDRNWKILGAKISKLRKTHTIRAISDGSDDRAYRHWRFVSMLNLINRELSEITGVPEAVLRDFKASRSETIATRFEWMRHRQTTKPEDLIYSQMGIFGVHMPLIYGEGRRKARRRLEQEIARMSQSATPSISSPVSTLSLERTVSSAASPVSTLSSERLANTAPSQAIPSLATPSLRISSDTKAAINYVVEQAIRIPNTFTPDLLEEHERLEGLSKRAANEW